MWLSTAGNGGPDLVRRYDISMRGRLSLHSSRKEKEEDVSTPLHLSYGNRYFTIQILRSC